MEQPFWVGPDLGAICWRLGDDRRNVHLRHFAVRRCPCHLVLTRVQFARCPNPVVRVCLRAVHRVSSATLRVTAPDVSFVNASLSAGALLALAPSNGTLQRVTWGGLRSSTDSRVELSGRVIVRRPSFSLLASGWGAAAVLVSGADSLVTCEF